MDDWEGNDMRKKTLIQIGLPASDVVRHGSAVYGDTGPKPSVNVTIEGLEGRACWATLLSAVPPPAHTALCGGKVRGGSG